MGSTPVDQPHSFQASLTDREGAVEIPSAQRMPMIVTRSEQVLQAKVAFSGQFKAVSLDEQKLDYRHAGSQNHALDPIISPSLLGPHGSHPANT